MEIEKILTKLEYLEGAFPLEEIQEVIQRKDEFIPHLLDMIKFATDNYNKLFDEDYMGHIYAMYLLSQFKEKKAFPLIIDLISIPPEKVEALLGDIITEDLHRILTSTYNGDLSLIKSVIQNDKLYQFVRSSAIDTFLMLYTNNIISRTEVIEYFRSLLQGKLGNSEDNDVLEMLISSCCELSPKELYDDIKKLYDDKVVEANMLCVGLGYVENSISKGKEQCLSELKNAKRFTIIIDAISEIDSWPAFNTNSNVFEEPLNLEAKSHKIGRNEPCPCGSRKKYKKCCLE